MPSRQSSCHGFVEAPYVRRHCFIAAAQLPEGVVFAHHGSAEGVVPVMDNSSILLFVTPHWSVTLLRACSRAAAIHAITTPIYRRRWRRVARNELELVSLLRYAIIHTRSLLRAMPLIRLRFIHDTVHVPPPVRMVSVSPVPVQTFSGAASHNIVQ